jgi:type I restriction enzyme S subunit
MFPEWFVDFNFPGATGEMQESDLEPIPVGWRVVKLGDVCRNIRNTTHPKDIEPNIPYVGLEHIPRKSMSLSSWGASEDISSQKSHFNKFNILFGKLRPYFHKVCIAPVYGICSTDVLVIEPLKKEYFSFCLNHLFSNELIAYVSGIADGTRMPRVDWKSISAYEISIPLDGLMQKFANLTTPIYEEMIQNNEESAALTTIRDALLPKLMSGEIVPMLNPKGFQKPLGFGVPLSPVLDPKGFENL